MVSSTPADNPERMSRERRQERDRDIVRLCVEGLPVEDAAARFDLRTSTVLAVLARHGISTRGRTKHRQKLARRNGEIVRLCVEGGLRPDELAVRFGLTPSHISRLLRKRGVVVPRRRRGTETPQHLRERNAEMLCAYVEESLSLRQTGARFGLSAERVRQIVERAGVSRGRRGLR
jgi:DNA-binding CsgD family transcriptional regulator